MKTRFFLSLLMFGFLNNFEAQVYERMTIQSGLNQDVIANGIGAANGSTTSTVDNTWSLVSIDYKFAATNTPRNFGLPVSGLINSQVASTPTLSYQLAPYNTSNSLRLPNNGSSGIISFSSPILVKTLYMLATSGGGESNVNIVVTFTDNTTQTFSGVILPDWYNAPNYAINKIGRINRNNSTSEGNVPSPDGPRLYQISLAIDVSNQVKAVQQVSITKISGGISNIFAFSAETPSSLGINEEKLEKSIIYPNPIKNNEIFVKGRDLKKASKAEIYDMKGSLIKTIIKPFVNSDKIKLENMAKGNYILKIDNTITKFIIE